MNNEDKKNWFQIILHTIFLAIVALWNLRLIGLFAISLIGAQALAIWSRYREGK